MNKKIIKIILSPFLGRKNFQTFFESLHQLSLIGMNIGGGSNPEVSGELQVLKYLNNHYSHQKTLVIFDVGANVGNYSKILAKVFGNKVQIYCFEPSVNTFKLLSTELQDYKQIKLHNFGLGDTECNMKLYSNFEGSGLASIYCRRLDHVNIQMNNSEEIEVKTLDKFCLNNGIKKINLLKLDVEGHEKKVLNGAIEMINSSSIDFIQFEFGGCNIDSRTYFQDFFYFLNSKYKIFRIVRDGLVPVDSYNERYEAFITTNYLAQRRDLLDLL